MSFDRKALIAIGLEDNGNVSPETEANELAAN
jgi:hypothetical protein